MALRLATSAALVSSAAATINLAIEDCGDSSTHGHVSGISPSSVEQGHATTVSGAGTLDTAVADGTFSINVKAAGVTVTSCKGDICSASKCNLPAGTGSVNFHGMACPAAAGDVSLDFDVSVSRFVPSSLATLEIDMSAEGSAGKLICAKLNTSPAAVAMAAPDWEAFKATYGKTYNGADHEAEHRAVYDANMAANDEHNAQNLGWTQGENQFSDLTQEQFRVAAGLGYIAPENNYPGMPYLGEHEHNGAELAASVDWVTAGAVTPVKDQGQCGSCWAFSTTGGMEGGWQLASGSLLSLSEQQLVDCSTQNNGCNGGSMALAFTFESSQNVCSESSYPYTATDGSCRSSCTTAIPEGGITGYKSVGNFLFGASVSAMKSALEQNPVSIAIEADQSAFQHYSGGVLSSGCGTALDHGVLAAGYGTENGQEYWLVKNSWGTSWGDSGYLKVSTTGNVCGVLKQPVYPTVSATVAV